MRQKRDLKLVEKRLRRLTERRATLLHCGRVWLLLGKHAREGGTEVPIWDLAVKETEAIGRETTAPGETRRLANLLDTLWDTQTLLKALGGDGNEPATPDTAQQQALLRLLISCVPYPPDGLNSENPTDRAVALFEVLLKTQRDIAGMIADQDSEYDLVVYLKTPLEDLNLGLQDRASRFYPRRRRCCIK